MRNLADREFRDKVRVVKQKSDPAPVDFFNLYTGEIESESVYGEKCLRWAYERPPGRMALAAFIKRPWFSRLYGKWADTAASRKEIAPFIEKFGLTPDEFLDPPESYGCFNDFFSRKLKPSARPVCESENAVAFPADGRHLVIENLSQDSWIFAKGKRLNLVSLLGGDDELAGKFAGGTAIVSRLCPTDYHRFHFPAAGIPGEPRLINGPLYSVNPIALSRNLAWLWENKRQITRVENSPAGEYLFLEIGATNVGSIINTHAAGKPAEKGDEKGYFRFGGSMVMMIFQSCRITPISEILQHSGEGREIYARMGDRAAEVK